MEELLDAGSRARIDGSAGTAPLVPLTTLLLGRLGALLIAPLQEGKLGSQGAPGSPNSLTLKASELQVLATLGCNLRDTIPVIFFHQTCDPILKGVYAFY